MPKETDSTIDSREDPPVDGLSVLGESNQALTEFLTGLLGASEKKEWALSVGYLFQRIRGGQFINQLHEEIRKYRQKGRIQSDYLQSDQGLDCLKDVLEFVDRDSPDATQFSAIRQLFLTIASETQSTRDDVLPKELMRICRTLSSGELIVLSATYTVCQSGTWKSKAEEKKRRGLSGSTEDWVTDILTKTGLEFPELVRIHESNLVEKRLLDRNEHGDLSGFRYTDNYRLTPLGYTLCKFIVKSEDEA